MAPRICVFLLAAVCSSAPAGTLDVSAVQDAADGSGLQGLSVTVTYLVGGSEVAYALTWVATGPTSGAAERTVPGFPSPLLSVSLSGDAAGVLAWTFNSLLLDPIRLTLDGGGTGVVFDRSLPNPGSAGSGPGADFVSSYPGPFSVSYENPVRVGGNAFAGDLYGRVIIDWSSRPDRASILSFQFTQDADLAVPEPATGELMLVLVTAGLVLAAMRSPRMFRER